MSDFLDKLKNDKNSREVKHFNKQAKKTEATAPKGHRKRRGRSITINYYVYRRLKIASAMNDMRMGEMAGKAIKYCLDNHKF